MSAVLVAPASTPDPKTELKALVGDLDDFELFNNQVLCAVYVRPEKTQGGVFLTDAARAEDKIQGKVGLVVKKGAAAFDDSFRKTFSDVEVGMDDWVVFRPSDGWSITINKVLCRILDDTNIRGRIQRPDQVW